MVAGDADHDEPAHDRSRARPISSPRIRRPRTSSARRSGAPSNWATSATLKTTGPWTAPQRITASNATSASDGPQIPTARGVATSDSAALAVP